MRQISNIFSTILVLLLSIALNAQNPTKKWIKEYENNTLLTKNESLFKIIDYYLYAEENLDSVVKYISLVDTLVTSSKDSLYIAKKLHCISVVNYRLSAYEVSMKNAKKAIQLFERYDDYYSAALVKRDLGNTLQVLFENKEALINFKEASNYLEGKDRIPLLIGFAAIYTQLNDLDKAIQYYKEAKELSEKNKDSPYLYNVYNGMAIVYDINKDYNKSLLMLNNALSIAQQENDFLGQIVCLHNIGDHYLESEEYQKAMDYFEQSLPLFPKTENEYIKGVVFIKYAIALLNLDQLDKATSELNKAEQIFNEIKNTGRIPLIINTKAKIELKKGNISKAIILLEDAIKMPISNRRADFKLLNYLTLAEAYKDANNANLSFKAFENYIRITDSVEQQKKIKDIELFKIQFEVAEMEQENTLLATKNKTAYYQRLLLGFLSLALIFFIVRQRKLIKIRQKAVLQEKEIIALNEVHLKDKIKFKNSQITKYAIQIDERNKFLESIKEKIKSIQTLSESKEQKAKLNSLQYFIKDNININKEKVELDRSIKNKEEDFRFNLEREFPKLTEKEIIVCKLLSLDLSSKQIAQSMNINVQSVNNYRASIRKKINLEKGVNLKRFLKNF